MLSLLAVTSASMGAYANADLTSRIDTTATNWKTTAGTKLTTLKGIITSPGATITQPINLLPGVYKFSAETLANAKISVINGTTEYTNGEFELTSPSEVTIKVAAATAGQFTVGNFNLTLVYDFADAAKQLTVMLSDVINNIKGTASEVKTYKDEASKISVEIANIKDDAYNYYGDYHLYDGYEKSTVAAEIRDLKARVLNSKAYSNAVDTIASMNTKLSKVKQTLTNAYAISMYASDATNISNEIADFQSKAEIAYNSTDPSANASVICTDSNIKTFYKKVTLEIDSLNNNIVKANQNDSAYSIVVGKIADVKSLYTKVLQELVATLTGVYGDMLSEAQGKLNLVLVDVAKAEKANGTTGAHNHDGALISQSSNETLISSAKASIKSVESEYTMKAKELKGAYTADTLVISNLTTALKSVNITGVESKFTKTISTIQGQITALQTKIDQANQVHTVNTLSISVDSIAIQTAIAAFKKNADAAVINYSYKNLSEKTITGLQSNFDSAKKIVNALTYKTYKVSGKYTARETALQATITKYKNAAAAADSAGTAKVQYENDSTNFVNTNKDIVAYQKNAQTAFDAFKTAVDSISNYTIEYNALVTKATNVDVTTITGKTYKTKLIEIKKEIDNVQKALDDAVAKTGDDHYAALTTLNVNISIYSEIKILVNSYTADLKKYNDNITTTSVKTLLGTVTTKITSTESSLPNASSYTKIALGDDYDVILAKLAMIKDSLKKQESIITAQSLIVQDSAFSVTQATTSKTILENVDKSLTSIQADIKNWQTAAQNAINNVLATKQAAKNILAEADSRVSTISVPTYTATVLGKDSTTILNQITVIKTSVEKQMSLINAQRIIINNDSTFTVAQANTAITILTAVNTALKVIELDIDSLIASAKVAKDNVNKNITASTTAKNYYDDIFSYLYGNVVTGIKSISALNEDPNKDFSQVVIGLKDELKGLSDTIESSYKAQTLVTDWTEIKIKLDAVKTKINTTRENATNATINYKAYLNQQKEVTDAAIQNVINQANIDILAPLSTGSALIYYQNLIISYQTTLNSIIADIEKYYKAGTSAQNTITERIRVLKANIIAVKTDAQKNETAHNGQLNASVNVQNNWTMIQSYITNNDLSVKAKKEYLSKLDSLQTMLNSLNINVSTNFGMGKSDEENASLISQYEAINSTIINIKQRQEAGYQEALRQDNDDRYSTFQIAVGMTEKTYADAIKTINYYSDIKDQNYQVTLENILKTDSAIYDYASKIIELKANAKVQHDTIFSPSLYDENQENVSIANSYTSAISTILNNFTHAVVTRFKETDIATVESKLSEAQKELYAAGYDTLVVNKAFNDVNELVIRATQALDAVDFASKIDAFLTQFGTVKDLIATDKETVALNRWNNLINPINNQIDNKKKEFGQYVGQTFLSEYTDLITQTLTAANDSLVTYKKKNTVFANLSSLITLVNTYTSSVAEINNKVALYNKNISDNNKVVVAMTDSLGKVQTAFDNVKEYVSSYFIANKLDNRIGFIQDSINALKASIETLKKGGAETKKNSILAICDSLSKEVKKIISYAYFKEKDGLTDAISILKSDYNSAVAAPGVVIDSLKPYNTRIDGFILALTAIKDTVTAKNAFLTLESEIAVTRTELVTIYNKSLIDTTHDLLLGKINSLNQILDKIGKYENVVTTQYTEQLIQKRTRVTTFTAKVENYYLNRKMLFYSDNLLNEFININTDISGLDNVMTLRQDTVLANNEAYKRLTANIDSIKSIFEKVVDAIDKNKYATDIVTIEALIKAETDSISSLNSGYKLSATSKLQNKAAIITKISNLNEWATYNLAKDGIGSLSTLLNDVFVKLDTTKFTAADYKSLIVRYKDLKEENDTLRLYNDQVYSDDGTIYFDVYGKPLKDENGNVVQSLTIDYMTDAIPVVNARIAELKGLITKLKSDVLADSYMPGDLNKDGAVRVDDYSELQNIVVGAEIIDKTTPDGKAKFNAADANGDGEINVGDVTRLAKAISENKPISINKAPRRAASATVENNNDAISISSEAEGSAQRIAINLANSTSYVACQMDIKLPTGMTLLGESLSGRANGHSLVSNNLNDGTHRVLISTIENSEFNNSESAILYLDVNVTGSNSTVSISNVIFTDADAHIYHLAGVNSGTTGINAVTGESVGSKIYSVGGKLLNTLQKGVNIIRNANGSTKKIVNK